MGWTIEAAERGLVPDALIRVGIRRLLRARLHEIAADPSDEAFLASTRDGPIARVPDEANAQHYRVPPALFALMLGPQLKYSCALWEDGSAEDLAAAEEAMLSLTAERAGLADGQRVLELGCGWGSLSLWMARRYPHSRILAVSNSPEQRAHIETQAAAEGLDNLRVKTADMNALSLEERFDRIVSVEMFEHMWSWSRLLERLRGWAEADGRLLVHHFAHRTTAYPYEDRGDDDWMTRHFFSGGIMPAADLLARTPSPWSVEESWWVNGQHYQRTCEAWLKRLDGQRGQAEAILRETHGAEARRQVQRWRMFHMACAELFAHGGGETWGVVHTRLAPAR